MKEKNPSDTRIRILLADDHAVLRAGLRLLLNQQPGYQVVGEASSGLAALTLAEELQPDLILLDLTMPGLNGLDALPSLLHAAPEARVLILTMHDDPQYLHQAIKLGAAGYMLKKAADSELIAAIQAVLRGEVYVHSSMTRALLKDIIPKSETSQQDMWETLSPREQQVLRLVALGHTSSEIAEQLNLSQKTVDTYRARGMDKLGFHTRAALVRFAIHHGLLSLE